jgi:glycerol uptake facilitator-like aquaporin
VTLARGFTTTFAGIAINHVPGFIAAQLIGAAVAAATCAVLFSPRTGGFGKAVEPGE